LHPRWGIAIGRGKDKEEMARKLGAIHYVDNRPQNAVEELANMGGAKVILATVPSGKAMSAVLDGLTINDKLIAIGAGDENSEGSPLSLICGRRSIMGWPGGTCIDSQDTLSFSVLSDVRSIK
jgi:D-arabinose 1-dehydrogenase-like Zn-dependent alcohol dehydrogenase